MFKNDHKIDWFSSRNGRKIPKLYDTLLRPSETPFYVSIIPVRSIFLLGPSSRWSPLVGSLPPCPPFFSPFLLFLFLTKPCWCNSWLLRHFFWHFLNSALYKQGRARAFGRVFLGDSASALALIGRLSDCGRGTGHPMTRAKTIDFTTFSMIRLPVLITS